MKLSIGFLISCFEKHNFLFSSFPTAKLKVNWMINKLLLPHDLYSGAKHIPLSSQRPSQLIVLLAPISFRSDKYNAICLVRLGQVGKSLKYTSCQLFEPILWNLFLRNGKKFEMGCKKLYIYCILQGNSKAIIILGQSFFYFPPFLTHYLSVFLSSYHSHYQFFSVFLN